MQYPWGPRGSKPPVEVLRRHAEIDSDNISSSTVCEGVRSKLLLRLRSQEYRAEILEQYLAPPVLVAEVDDLLQLIISHVLTELFGHASQILETYCACGQHKVARSSKR